MSDRTQFMRVQQKADALLATTFTDEDRSTGYLFFALALKEKSNGEELTRLQWVTLAGLIYDEVRRALGERR